MLSGIGAALTFLSGIHIACEAGRQTVEHGAAARRRPQVLMHGEPQAELEIEGGRQHAHQIHLLPGEPHLTDADAEACLDRAPLRDVAVGPKREAQASAPGTRLRMARMAGVSRSKPIKLWPTRSPSAAGVPARLR
jgi:hypothetical protein